MTYKLLVLDLDGTLTNTKKEITPRNIEALVRLQQKGVRLVLASGRPTFGIVPLANQLRMKEFGGFILSFNGGEIINVTTGQVIYQKLLPDDVIPYLYDCARRNNLAILTHEQELIVTEAPDNGYVKQEAFLNKMTIKATNNFLADIHLPVAKCLIVGDPEPLMRVEAEISAHLQGKISVYRSEPYFLELVPLDIDKAYALSLLLKELGMTRQEMVAVGDGFNDLTMITYAGLGIAMANAQEPVKQAADYITLSNEEDGVAEVVERFF